jgi:AsmA protein
VLVALAAGAVAFALYALPANFVRDRMIAEVKARTGRDLVVAGPARFTIYPSIGVSLADVSLSPPQGMAGQPLVRMAALDVAVPLLPLLKREVKVDRLVLRAPVFNLAVDGQGRKSWEFAANVEEAAPVRLAQAPSPASDAPGGLPSDAGPAAGRPAGLARIDKLALGDVRIEDGTVHYSDARTGAAQEIKSLNVDIDLPALSSPLTAKGSLAWRARKVDFDGKLNSLKSVLDDVPAKVAVAISSDAAAANFDGSASFKDAIDAEGAVVLRSPSVRRLAQWLGSPLPPSRGFGALDAKGDMRAAGSTVTLSNAEIALDGANATGEITVETGAAARPQVKTSLRISALDLNLYATDASAAAAAPPSPNTQKKPAATPDKNKPQSIDDLLAREPAEPGPKVKGFTQRAGWSEEPIDLAILGLVDADAKLSVGKVLVRDIKVGQSALTVALKNRVLKTTLDDVRLYEGQARGVITVDASAGRTASIGGNVALDGISALPFLEDAAAIDWLAGKCRVQLALAGQGANQREIIETLNGKADIAFADGAIVGLNIPQMVRGLGQGRVGDLKSAPTEKTDFSELAATWTVQSGIAQNQDLRLVSPLLRITGAGNVMLPARAVDYTVRPKLVATLTGQGGAQNLAGLEIPVRIHGSWAKPKLTPDIAGVLKDPKTVETIKEIGKQFKGKNAKEIVNELLGDGSQQGEAQANGEKNSTKETAKRLLDQLLSGSKSDGDASSAAQDKAP